MIFVEIIGCSAFVFYGLENFILKCLYFLLSNLTKTLHICKEWNEE